MGSALAFPAAENGHEVRIVGTCLDDEIIDGYIKTGKHEKFCRPFPSNVKYYYFKDWKKAVEDADFVIGGVSSFGVDWFLEEILTQLDETVFNSPKKEAYLFRFNPEKYNELKQKGFRLEF